MYYQSYLIHDEIENNYILNCHKDSKYLTDFDLYSYSVFHVNLQQSTISYTNYFPAK